MVHIVIAALAKGMAVANLTLEVSLTLLNTSLRSFVGVGEYSDPNSSMTIHTERQRHYSKRRNS